MSGHLPVMLDEVLEALAPRAGETYLDGTFGAGGYTRAILRAADCRVIGVDRDPTAIAGGKALSAEFAGRLTLVEGCFGDMEALVGAEALDGVVLDLGVSSMQIDRAERGFSFQKDGPLDMRMGGSGPTAADVVNTYDPGELAEIFRLYGEEKRARAIARAIAEDRVTVPFETTAALAGLVARVIGRTQDRIHPATRVFQALRIFVNDELGEVVRGLAAAEKLLKAGGRLVVVTFHSLEDRIVKRFLQSRGGRVANPSRHEPEATGRAAPSFALPGRQPIGPSAAEVEANPRARSAKLRIGIRTEAAPHAFDLAGLGLPRLSFGEGI